MYVIPVSQQVSIQKNQTLITDIYAEELLGYYTYKIHYEGRDRLLIIYGDNGSGKTTLLKLVYHLLSTESNQGHKSALANVRFKTISVTLSNGIIIMAKRNDNNKGPFVLSIKSLIDKELDYRAIVRTAEQNGALTVSNSESEDNPAYGKVISLIKNLGISLYFLQDDRDLLTASANKRKIINSTQLEKRLRKEVLYNISQIDESKKSKQKFLIEEAFDTFNDWIKAKVITFSSIGESNNQSIYFDLIKSISASAGFNDLNPTNNSELLGQLEEISILNQSLANIGLVTSFDYLSLINIIRQTEGYEKLMLIQNVLTPFIEGATAKLNALSEIYNIITLFISNINDYFFDKVMRYSLSEGFSVLHHNGDIVQMSELSSGEKHLLHLWINSIIAEDATIFIIDEPEISLNIKWQRRLLDSLLSYTQARNIQFVIATHSIELLANNMDSVVKLVNSDSVFKND